MAEFNGKQGVWRTVGGRKIFIVNGQDLPTAMKLSGKFEKKDDIKFPENVNEKQKRTIKDIVDEIPHFDFYGDNDNYEIKRLDISADQIGDYDKYSVSVIIETGRKNDEGTLEAILGRKKRQFWVGDNGGIKIMNDKTYKFERVSKFDLLNKHYFH